MQMLLCGGKPCLTMEAPHTSSTSTCLPLLTFSDSDEYDERNEWNLMLNLFCHEYVGAVMESYLDVAVLGRIAPSCHFAFALLCDKAEFHYRPTLWPTIAASLPFRSTRFGRFV